ncbi:cytidine and dCMP deaminase domain-containing protein 1-like [Glandiceps talaboti]
MDGTKTNHEGEQYNSRLSKNDMSMLMALWMQMSPLAKTPRHPIKESPQNFKINRVGVVILNADGKLFAADHSQEFAHGIMSALLKYTGRLTLSTVFVSRKPCYECTKHMIQVGVKKVYYFPIEPEIVDEHNLATADHIFKVNHIAIKALIPRIRYSKDYDSPFTKEFNEEEFEKGKRSIQEDLGTDIYQGVDKTGSDYVMSVSQVPDPRTRERRKQEFEEVVNWLARKTMADVPSTHVIDHKSCDASIEHLLQNQKLVRHAAALTHILSHRTDDPTTGVGAVLLNHRGHYVGFGYNGYQLDAEETDFPYLGDKEEPDKRRVKFSYIVHAEINALFFRNQSELDSEKTVLFTSKVPCDHCTLSLKHAGIKHVVVPEEKKHRTAKSEAIGYGRFDDYCDEGHFVKYLLKEPLLADDCSVKRQLTFGNVSSDKPVTKIQKT